MSLSTPVAAELECAATPARGRRLRRVHVHPCSGTAQPEDSESRCKAEKRIKSRWPLQRSQRRGALHWLVSQHACVKTLKISSEPTKRNWNVNGLLGRRTRTLSWEKTLDTSRAKTTTRANWNVNGLLDDLDKRPESWRFHRSAVCGSLSTERDGNDILGTTITCSGIGKSKHLILTTGHQLVHHLRHKRVENLHHGEGGRGGGGGGLKSTVRCWTFSCGPHPGRVAGNPGALPHRAGRGPAGEEGASVAVARRACLRARPCPSSDAVRCGE